MTGRRVDVAAAMADLKDFQRRTARWAFQRMFADSDPALRFLVADEVGLGKTHVAKGVIAQVIDHLGRTGDKRHDIVYICSNAAIARQNLRKLVPEGIEPTPVEVDRLTMLPLVRLKGYRNGRPGINLLAITPGTSLNFGASTGRFTERALAYTLLRRHWGAEVMEEPARWIFWYGLRAGSRADRDNRLRWHEEVVSPARQSVARRVRGPTATGGRRETARRQATPAPAVRRDSRRPGGRRRFPWSPMVVADRTDRGGASGHGDRRHRCASSRPGGAR